MTPIILELPMPPSVNSIWHSRRGAHGGKPQYYLDAKYKAWKLECDGIIWTAGWIRGWNKIGVKLPLTIPVKVDITLDQTRKRGDADNRQKAVNDWLQRAGIVENDKLIEDSRSHWGVAEKGCRVVVEAIA